jgi:carboxymethylenebutenolidase
MIHYLPQYLYFHLFQINYIGSLLFFNAFYSPPSPFDLSLGIVLYKISSCSTNFFMTSTTFKDVPYYFEGKEGSYIGIIVIQEWWGLNQHIKNVTGRFAKALDCLAITPDLYRGKVASDSDEANHLMTSLNWTQAVQDIKHASEFLRSKGCKKIGVVGFCMGGALTIASSVLASDSIDAGSCFYGIPPTKLADPKLLNIPMQFHFGDKDKAPGFSDPKAADQLRSDIESSGNLIVHESRHSGAYVYEPLQRKGKVAEFHRYVDGNHAFMNEEAPAFPFNEPVASLAMKQTIDFFKTYLK